MQSTVAYIDASAAVKLAFVEPETPALVARLTNSLTHVSSELLEIELACTARRLGHPGGIERCRSVTSTIHLLPLSDSIRDRACEAFDPPQRALDAIHLATALTLDIDALALISYDRDQLAAARAAGIAVVTPGLSG